MLILRKLLRHKKGLVGAVVLVAIVLTALLAPILAPHDPQKQDVTKRFVPPMPAAGSRADYPLGTDALGRDMLSRIIYGSRVSLVIGLASVLVSGLLGVVLGVTAGFFGGRTDSLVMRLADIQLAIPFLILALAVMAVLGSTLTNLVITLGVTGWVTYGRVARAEVLSVREREFIQATQALGIPMLRVLSAHVLPNILPSINVIATLEVGRMILAEASLSFLGLGVPPSIPTWGGIAANGRDYLATAWWVSTFPGLAILVTVLAINFLGDWLRDEFDPRLKV